MENIFISLSLSDPNQFLRYTSANSSPTNYSYWICLGDCGKETRGKINIRLILQTEITAMIRTDHSHSLVLVSKGPSDLNLSLADCITIKVGKWFSRGRIKQNSKVADKSRDSNSDSRDQSRLRHPQHQHQWQKFSHQSNNRNIVSRINFDYLFQHLPLKNWNCGKISEGLGLNMELMKISLNFSNHILISENE